MYVLIVIRRGTIIGVFSSGLGKNHLKHKAERIDGATLTWNDYLSHIGAHSNHDEERSYTIHPAEGC